MTPRDESRAGWPVVGVAALLLLACGCAGNNKQALLEALQEYNDSVRWQRSAEVADYLVGEQRVAFVAQVERHTDVQVSDCRIGNIQLRGESLALALVTIDWYSLRTARAHRTVIQQTWGKRDGKWKVTGQRGVKGPTFPLFAATGLPLH